MNEQKLKTLTALIAIFGLIFSLWQFLEVQKIEAARPYLEKKLVWCEEIVELTSKIATSNEIMEDDVERFWQMYWGVMGLIEKEDLLKVMIEYGKDLESRHKLKENESSLKKRSLAIAHACRNEFTKEWSSKWTR